jgi:hypothetical protein
MIKYQELGYKAYVTGDGHSGVESVVVFDYEDLYDKYPKVWEIIENMNEYFKYDFIVAFLEQDMEVLEEAAAEHDFDISLVIDKDN